MYGIILYIFIDNLQTVKAFIMSEQGKMLKNIERKVGNFLCRKEQSVLPSYTGCISIVDMTGTNHES